MTKHPPPRPGQEGLSNVKNRRSVLGKQQLAALAELGYRWEARTSGPSLLAQRSMEG